MTTCPRCGASNPQSTSFCGKCGHFLGSAAPPPSATPPTELPAWLEMPADSPPPSAAKPQVSSATELPAWLTDLGVDDDQPATPAASDTPAWLSELQQTTPQRSTPPVDGLPEWLRSAEAAPSALPAGSSATDELPPWLRSEEPSSPATPAHAEATDELPDWLRSETAPPATATISAPDTDELPAWLRADEDLVADASKPEAAAQTADWPAAATPAPAQTSAELPAWLRADTEVPPAPAPANSAELPDWLQELEAQPAQIESQTAAGAQDDWSANTEIALPAPESGAQQTGVGADELPPWLREDNSTATTSQPIGSGDSQLPAWLTDFEASTDHAAPTEAKHDELLPWLTVDDAAVAAPSQQAGAAPGAEDGAAAELPAWLNDAAPAAETPAAGGESAAVPSWLADEAAEPLPTASPASARSWLDDEPATSASNSDVEVPLPDWGSELGEAPQAQAPTFSNNELPAWLNEATGAPGSEPTPSPSDTNSLPAWLIEESPTAPVLATQSDTGSLPSWLVEASPPAPAADMSTVAQQPTPPAQASGSDELPAWLSSGSGATDVPDSAQRAAAPVDELPSWLTDDDAAEPASLAPAAAQGSDPSATQELPAWLLEAPLGGQDEPASAALPAADELPPWLQATDEPPPAAPADVPGWLALPDEPSAAEHTAQADTTPDADALPSWLADPDEASRDATPSAPSQAEPTWSNANTVQLPASLAAADAPEGASPAAAGSTTALPPWLSDVPDEPAPTPRAASGLPAWLDETAQPATDTQAASDQSELLGGLDLPAWLRDESGPSPGAAVAEPAPDWLQHVTPDAEEAPVPAPVVAAPPPPRIERSPERIASMQLLNQLLTEPAPEPTFQAPHRRRSRALTVVLVGVALLIIATLLAVLLSSRLGLNFGAAPADPPVVASAAQLLTALPPNRPVLLAYEWDAQRLGELRPLEQVVMRQLAARQNVPLIFVSTDPQGALLANERTAQLESLGDQYHLNGLGYVNLGFKAGGALALRRFAGNTMFGALFAQDASGIDLRANDIVMESMCGTPTVDGCSWDNVSLLVIMADDVDDVRSWFEQVRSEHPGLQTLLLTPAEIAPQVQPYAAGPNVALLSGLRGAEAFARVQGLPDERISRQVDAVALGNVMFAAAVVLGGLPAVLLGRRARRTSAREAEGHVWDR